MPMPNVVLHFEEKNLILFVFLSSENRSIYFVFPQNLKIYQIIQYVRLDFDQKYRAG
jgi:hypothetical protein